MPAGSSQNTSPIAYAVVDSFSEGPFTGNPAGVIVLDESATETWMQQVAAEINRAETAFVRPREDGEFDLRWFTPTNEVGLCGHATLASAHWMIETGRLEPDQEATFHSLSGPLRARRGEGEAIRLDFPSVPAGAIDPPPGLAEALGGVEPLWFGVTEHEHPAEINYLAALENEAAVRALTPNLPALAELPAGGLMVTADADPDTPADVVSRYFAPALGIPEDPVTGSAHCTIGPYWAGRHGPEIEARQLSERGGRMRVTIAGDRVHLEGVAVTTLRGEVLAR